MLFVHQMSNLAKAISVGVLMFACFIMWLVSAWIDQCQTIISEWKIQSWTEPAATFVIGIALDLGFAVPCIMYCVLQWLQEPGSQVVSAIIVTVAMVLNAIGFGLRYIGQSNLIVSSMNDLFVIIDLFGALLAIMCTSFFALSVPIIVVVSICCHCCAKHPVRDYHHYVSVPITVTPH